MKLPTCWLTRALLSLCVALLFVGCTKPRTQVLVRVYADPQVQQALSSVSVSVWSLRGPTWQKRLAREPVKRTNLLWPLELGVTAERADDVRFDVVASAFDSQGKRLVFDRAVARLSPERTRVLELHLVAACMAEAPCAEPDSCHGESCMVCKAEHDAPACVPAGERATSPYRPVSHGFTEAMPLDAGPADGGMNDASSAELGGCTPEAGTLEQGSCGEGMRCAGKPGARRCEDIDECEREPTLCAPGTCENTEGSFVCRCPDDYEGTFGCTPVGRCVDDDICTPGRCTFDGPDLCWCFQGFVSTSQGCADVDECAEGACGELPCQNVPGSYLCQCAGSDTWCAPDQPCRTSAEGVFCQGDLADWPMPSRAANASHPVNDERLPDDIVHDLVTGLYWYDLDDLDVWPGALEFCRTLELGGRDDWRVPTPVELMSRADSESCPPCSSFTNQWAVEAWTARRLPPFEDALYVKMESGEIAKTWIMDRREVVCVSGEPTRGTARAQRYQQAASSELLLDTQTELAWQRVGFLATWAQAAAACANLSLAGHDDYRLPTSKELYTLMNFEAPSGPPAELMRAPGATRAWTSQAMGQRLALALSFETGELSDTVTDLELEARCVRTGP